MFRNGKWLKIRVSDEEMEALRTAGCHFTADGYAVGIFQAGGLGPLVEHKTAEGKSVKGRVMMPDHIVMVRPDGLNLRVMRTAQSSILLAPMPDLAEAERKQFDGLRSEIAALVVYHPSMCAEILPISDRKDIPAERLKHVAAGWQPRP